MDDEAFGVVYKFLVFTFVYFIGRWNFSINWLFPLFISTAQEYFNRKRENKKDLTHAALQLSECDRVLSRLDSVPAWVLFPDFEKAEWINQILKQFWPKINRFVERTVRDFEPLLQQQKILKSFRFNKIDLGNVVPHVTGIKVYDKNILVDEIIVDLNLCYFGDCELSFTLNGIGGGLKDIETEGAMRIILKRLVDRLPFVSAIQIYFLKHPTVNYELTMGLSSLDMFVTGDLIRSLIREQISLLMVYPNKIQIDIDKDIPSAPHEMPDIQCVIRVKIDAVRDIKESEIFAVVELGGDSHKTPGVDVDEEYKASFNYTCDLISYRGGDDEVHIIINRSNENKAVKVAKISFDLVDIRQKGCISGNFLLEPYGTISAKICWIELTDDKLVYLKTENCSLLQVYIDSGRSVKAKFLPLVEISINNQSKQTPATVVNREVASWRKHFNFFVENVETDSLTITLIDQLSLQDIGSYVYNIKDLVLRRGMEHELQAFPLNGIYNSEIIMALKLNFLISPE